MNDAQKPVGPQILNDMIRSKTGAILLSLKLLSYHLTGPRQAN